AFGLMRGQPFRRSVPSMHSSRARKRSSPSAASSGHAFEKSSQVTIRIVCEVKVVVRLFAGLRERAGIGERDLELPEGARLSDVWPLLGLGDEPAGLLYAVNKQYADAETELAPGDEVALIPPVSGGAFRLGESPLDPAAVID